MAHIGMVIRNFRERCGLSRSELSQHICTEKYLYLIETGKRSPSSHILYKFSDMLQEDLFQYYRFLDCIDPVSVCHTVNGFNWCHQKGDYIKLKELNSKAKNMKDFKIAPWDTEILLNELSIQLFIQKEHEKCVTKLNQILSDSSTQFVDLASKARFYVLLSTGHTILGNIEDAEKATFEAVQLIPDKAIMYHDQTHIAVHINALTSYYYSKNYQSVCMEGLRLLKYLQDSGIYDRILYICFFVSFAFYHTGDFNNAFFYFKKGLYNGLTDYRPLDIYNISLQDLYWPMMEDSRADHALVKEFLKLYGTPGVDHGTGNET